MAATATPATTRSDFAASTNAPPGIWPIKETKPAADKTSPMSTCVQRCVVRKTETNGPKPVCTSATKKMNQSSPRRLHGEGVDGGSVPPGGSPYGGPGPDSTAPCGSGLSRKRREEFTDRIHLQHSR